MMMSWEGASAAGCQEVALTESATLSIPRLSMPQETHLFDVFPPDELAAAPP